MEHGEPDIAVHHLSLTEAAVSPASRERILDEAARLVLATTQQTKWFSPRTVDSSEIGASSNAYMRALRNA